jgi:hypothetical protein
VHEVCINGAYKLEKYLKEYICDIVVFLMFYGIMLVRHYSVDSYTYFADPLQNNEGNLALGRFGDYFINLIVCKLNLNYVTHQFFFVSILIATFIFSSKALYSKFVKASDFDLTQKVLIKLSIWLMYCNVFVQEWFSYVEMDFAWSLSILFMTMAVFEISSELDLKSIIKITLLCIISFGFYQATIGYFISFGIVAVYIVHKGNLNRQSFVESIKLLMCGFLSGLFNVVLIKVWQMTGKVQQTSRTESLTVEGIVDNLKVTLSAVENWVVNSNTLLPQYFLLTAISIIVALVVLSIFIEKSRSGDILYIVLVALVCNVLVYAPHLMTSSIWMAQRTIVSFWVIFLVPCTFLAVKYKGKWLDKIAVGVIFLVFLLNWYKVQDISVDVIVKNRLDEEIAYMIQERIQNYQSGTGVTIEKIGVTTDSIPAWTYASNNYTCYDTNLREYVVEWAAVDCINYYNNTKYKKCDISEEIYTKYFEGKNWDSLNLNEQMIFENDTVYLAGY